jgi:hypothetical protein
MTSTPTIAKDGFTFARSVLRSNAITQLVEASVAPEDGRGGVRNLLDLPAFRNLADSTEIRALVEPILGTEAFPVRGILFDKTGEANWNVPWHQDRAFRTTAASSTSTTRTQSLPTV